MKQSRFFYKTLKEDPKSEEAASARLLVRAGYVDKVMAGVYTFLPLGFRVLKKVEQIIREEMNAVEGQEMLMSVLQPQEFWQKTKRWESFDVLFKLNLATDKKVALGPTHEEIITPLAQKIIFSYNDLPLAVYQIQTKFRNEPRARSGILRGREFIMKDLYSFHANEDDLDYYYQKVARAYEKIWERVGLGDNTIFTYASGGAFSKYSHEFQTLSAKGEDTIYLCNKCQVGVNKEIVEDLGNKCPECSKSELNEQKTIEVGNIFKLKTKFSDAFGFRYTDKKGKEHPVIMASYGIGVGRTMATIVEVHNDEKGIIWPKSVTPFHAHLINLAKKGTYADEVYKACQKSGFDVLYDDRDLSAGEKFAEADLLGITIRLVVGDKNAERIEWKERTSKKTNLLTLPELGKTLEKFYFNV